MKIYSPNFPLTTSSNITFVPLSGDIETYISNATAGDTLILAAGTYTVTADITVGKSLCILGQGVGKTIVTNATTDYTFSMNGITTGEVVALSDMTIINTAPGGYAVRGYSGGNGTWNGYNLVAISTGTGNRAGLTHEEQFGNLYNCRSTVTSSDAAANAFEASTYDDLDTSVNYYNCFGISSSAAGFGAGLWVSKPAGDNIITVNAYNSQFKGSGAGSSWGICLPSNYMVANVYNCVLSGGTQDVENWSGTCSLYNTILLNNTTSGIITYSGTLVGSNFTTDGYVYQSVTSGITASVTQTQGQGVLTKEINQISVCTNINDTVTLPSAVAGMVVTVINSGAQTLQIFPASGDDLGAGVNTSTTLATTKAARFWSYDATTWVAESLN